MIDEIQMHAQIDTVGAIEFRKKHFGPPKSLLFYERIKRFLRIFISQLFSLQSHKALKTPKK